MTPSAEIPAFRPDTTTDPIGQRNVFNRSMVLRYALGVAVIAGSYVLKGLTLLPWPQLQFVAILFVAASAALHILLHLKTIQPRVYRVLPWFDVGFAPLFFAVSGGFLSPVAIVLMMTALHYSLRFTDSKNIPRYMFLYLTASYLGVSFLQKSGIVPWIDGCGNSGDYLFYAATAFTVMLFLAGYLMVRTINSRQIRLLEEHTRSFDRLLEHHEAAARRCAHAKKMEAIGRIAGGCAHDLNNNIAAISGYAAMLNKKVDGNEQCQAYIRHINEASKHASEILGKLTGSGHSIHMQPAQVDVTEAISSEVAKNHDLNSAVITITPPLPPAALYSPGDQAKFQTIFATLLQYAGEACPVGTGTVIIDWKLIDINEFDPLRTCFKLTDKSYIRISINDNGRGMSPEELDQLFEPRFATKSKGGSTRVDLANVWRYIIEFKGAIDVESTPGNGTTVHLYLPLTTTADHPPVKNSVSTHDSTSQAILIVDDELSLREIYSEILKDQHYQVFTSTNGAEAINFLESTTTPVGLILLDMMMPVMDGTATFYAVRKKYPSIKILFMSGIVNPEKIGPLLQEPGTAFFQKPCEDNHLLALVRSMLSPTAA